MPPAASAVTTLAAAFTAALAARTTPSPVAGARVIALAGLLGAAAASVRVSTELVAATDPAASPRSDLGLI